MESSFDVILAVIARVNEFILTLVMQLVQHAQCAVLSSAQRRELIVLITGHCQE